VGVRESLLLDLHGFSDGTLHPRGTGGAFVPGKTPYFSAGVITTSL
jgi:hypothetical protein